MPGPRRALAAVLCGAVVGLFLVSGAAMAQTSAPQRVTVGASTTGPQHVSLVKSATTQDHAAPHDVLAVLATSTPPTDAAHALPVLTPSDGVVAAHADRAAVRGPPVG